MNVIVVGSGAREHALCRILQKSYLCEKIFCFPGNYGISQIAECKDISTREDIIEECIKINPDLVIFPMQDSHILSFDLIRLSKKSKSLALIDNWDNLSSRGTYSIKPDYISVWGKQTKKHAIKYHNYNSQKIFLAGTPRFEEYFKLRNKKIKSTFPFRYILFLESFGNYNNTEFLDELDNIIKRNKIWKDLKIIYRPHPWQKKNNFSALMKTNLNNKLVISNKNFVLEENQSIKKIIEDLKIEFENQWKKFNIINVSIKLPITLSVNSKKYKLIQNLEKKLNELDLISNFYIESFNNKKLIYKIIYNSTPDKFINEFSNSNIKLNTGQSIWSVE